MSDLTDSKIKDKKALKSNSASTIKLPNNNEKEVTSMAHHTIETWYPNERSYMLGYN